MPEFGLAISAMQLGKRRRGRNYRQLFAKTIELNAFAAGNFHSNAIFIRKT
jgi:hypothetical protein